MPEHLTVHSSIIDASGSTMKTVAAALLEYDLTTEQKYPRQLQQASLALQHLLQIGYQPGDIFIGGDSAGGHLSVSLLSHLMHKHPAVPSVDLSGPLAGAFLISPWVTGDSSSVHGSCHGSTVLLADASTRTGSKADIGECLQEILLVDIFIETML